MGVRDSPVSVDFADSISRALPRVPENLREFVAREAYQIVIGRVVTETNHKLRGHKSRFFRPGNTWDSCIAVHDQTNKKISLGEYYRDFSLPGGPLTEASDWLTKRITWPTVLVHEFCHAVDYSYSGRGAYSHTPDFWKAYSKDLAGLSSRDREHWEYLIQGSDMDRRIKRGVCEAFAEILPAALGERGTFEPERILRRFPHSTDWIRNNIPLQF